MEEYSPVRYTVEERRYLLMMKWIKRLCSLILLCLLIAGGILLFQGYREYREALSGKSVEEMARQIESIDNYTSLDELPQTYIDAVLAVEDKRFYEHPGIDPIAIGRALLNDIRAGEYVERSSSPRTSTLHRKKDWFAKWLKCLWHLKSKRNWTRIRFWSCM